MDRRYARSGSPYEDAIGFSRAVRDDRLVHVAGTAPVWPDGSCDPDPEVQMRRCLEIARNALEDVGGRLGDVVRARMFLTDRQDAEAVGRAFREALGEVRPAATMVVVAALLDDRWKVEIELDAVLPGPHG